MYRINHSENLLMNSSGFEPPYFIEEDNFDQMIDLIQGESVHPIAKLGFEYDLLDGVMSGGQVIPTSGNAFGHDHTSSRNCDFVLDSLLSLGEDVKENLGDENDGEDSSGTTTSTTTGTATTPTKGTKTDRSRTLISERRRRGRMKEKLYALRSLVPNITKMDKASIVGDAVLYVQELQTQAKRLKAEIGRLEASWAGTGLKRYQAQNETTKRIQAANSNHSVCSKILQMDVFQVEERGFYVRLVCPKGVGVAVSLYKALESLTSFHVQNSNLATASSERFVFTFALHVKESEQGMTLPNLKLWITGALLNQGFEVKSPLSA
ncbi:transcription factor FER-LIKE IRON DEFICIENCY-INDUCED TRANSCRIPTION FACTOR [Rhodamnia argentea]|uniref:Transcription factor FER-LIKE IRON DEFICIENCY-INDUCED TRANSCRIPTION FACTOR n=1 Tax=Rhodamnia argentea TaxID=178133 RepID=A0A8B8NEG1_9MYRT|nr:transcription factor FER-LIKE IRON DEFICIENCY-INDUCED TRANSCRIPTION FACTOR [Rhodamnia argentea]